MSGGATVASDGGRWAWRLLLLYGGPSLVLLLLLAFFWQVVREERLERERTALDEALTDVVRESNHSFEVLLRDDLFRRRLRGMTADPVAVAAVVASWRAELPPGLVTLAVFDGAGAMLPVAEAASAAARLYAWVGRPASAPDLPDAAELVALGEEYPAPARLLRGLGRGFGSIGSVGRTARHSWVYCDRDGRQPAGRVAGVVASVHREALPPSFRLAWALTRCRAQVGAAMALLCDGRAIVAPPPLDRLPGLERLGGALPPRAAAGREWQGWLVSSVRVDRRCVLVGARPAPRLPLAWQLLIFCIYAVMTTYVLTRASRVTLGGESSGWSLRQKVRLCFLLALSLPLGLAAGLAAVWARQRDASLPVAHRQRMLRLLREIDDGARLFRQARQRTCRALVRRLRPLVTDEAALVREAERFLVGGGCDLVALVASGGRHLLDLDGQPLRIRQLLLAPRAVRRATLRAWAGQHPELGPRVERVLARPDEILASSPAGLLAWLRRFPLPPADERFISLLAEMMMAIYDTRQLGTRVGIGSPGDHAAPPAAGGARSLMVEGVMGDETAQICGRAVSRWGELLDYDNKVLFFDILPTPDGRAGYLVLVQSFEYSLAQSYLGRAFAGNAGVLPPITLHAIGLPPRRLSFPRDADGRMLDAALEPLKTGVRADVVEDVVLGGRRLQMVALRSQTCSTYDLVALTPQAWLAARLARERWRLLALGAALVALALALARLLERSLLAPVAELARGVAAMRGRDYSVRLRPLADDELGQLCAAFATGLRRMRELDLAQGLQSALQPPRRRVVGRYELLGASTMLQQVGGDYFDFLPLPDGRVAVVLGDVAGHGISAALVTAMAWTALHRLCAEAATPMAVLEQCNRALGETLRRSRMMTCILGFLDPEQGLLTLANAGQASPILVSADGSANFVAIASMPLGVSARPRLRQLEVPLAGGAVVLYSDGLVESSNAAGEPFDYWRMRLAAAGAVAVPGEAALDHLFAEVRAFLAPRTFTDDATVVLVRRRS